MVTIAGPVQSTNIVEFMKNSSAYPDSTDSVEMVETHISFVYLTDKYAYKLKKPIRFEFLDFTDAEARHQACLDELRLNRRFAPDVYLDVVPVTRSSSGQLALNGEGLPIDWVVKMRRLPAASALDVVIRERRLSVQNSQAIVKQLTDFYSRLLPRPIDSEAYRQALEHHIRANGDALLELLLADKTRIKRIQSAQLRFLNLETELIGNRAATGRIIEGHGDLRPEHIYLNGQPTIIDCVEFSEELRTIDVADELNFLAMECERLGEGDLGQAVFAEYERKSGDQVPLSLRLFYRCYRASVRAKVGAIRHEQQKETDENKSAALIKEYMELADRYGKQLGAPMLVVVGGLMGSGKSTLAAKLADAFGAEVLSTDHIRRELIGKSLAPAGYGADNYRPDMRGRVYEELFRQANEQLKSGQSVVLDGTFLTCCLRDRAFDLGSRNGAVSLHVQCTCPRKIAYARIQQRAETAQSESEARTELYDLQARDYEPPWADEPAVTIDTTQPLSRQTGEVFSELRRRM